MLLLLFDMQGLQSAWHEVHSVATPHRSACVCAVRHVLLSGLDEAEFAETISTLRRMADRLQCDLSIVCEKVVQQEPLMKCAEVMVRKFGVDDFVDIRISMCGHVGSGKSTLVGVLTRGVLDNGRGSARQNVFNHRHEVESGLTSSISQQILGFGSRGNVVNYGNDQLCHVPAERIAEMSSKVCTLYDLAGPTPPPVLLVPGLLRPNGAKGTGAYGGSETAATTQHPEQVPSARATASGGLALGPQVSGPPMKKTRAPRRNPPGGRLECQAHRCIGPCEGMSWPKTAVACGHVCPQVLSVSHLPDVPRAACILRKQSLSVTRAHARV